MIELADLSSCGTLQSRGYHMTSAEIGAAWLTAKKELNAIQLELAALNSELKRTGEKLAGIGNSLAEKPDMAWNIDTQTLSADILTAGVRAKRYNELLGKLADKQIEIKKFEDAS